MLFFFNLSLIWWSVRLQNFSEYNPFSLLYEDMINNHTFWTKIGMNFLSIGNIAHNRKTKQNQTMICSTLGYQTLAITFSV